jgi:adenine phosphoribosyltransferase
VRAVPDFPAPGIIFRDITPVLADPVLFHDAIVAMASAWPREEIDLVVGIESRGFVLGAAIAYHLGIGFVAVRKAGRLPGRTESLAYALEYGEATLEIHADAFLVGTRVLIVDDLLATGGTAAATIGLVDRLGGSVRGLAVLIELAELGGAAKLGDHPRTALLTI